MRPLVLACVLAACGGSSSPEPAGSSYATKVSLVAPPSGAADLEVARVNGRPIWGSCVTAQVTRGASDRKAALDECIAFELLAQDAEKRRLAADPSVEEALRRAMVNELVATEFDARYQKPEDLGAAINTVLDKNAWRMHRPAMRGSTYVRIKVEAGSPPEIEQRAHALADQIAAALANETGLTSSHLIDGAAKIATAAGTKIAYGIVPPFPLATDVYEEPYRDAVYSISEVGRISHPTRTSFGWDVIAFTEDVPAVDRTREQLAEEVFPDLRRAQFQVWVNHLIKASGIKLVTNLAPLEAASK